MKHLRRVLCICLTAALIIGTLCTGAAADSSKQYDTYTMLGDSIPAGYGLDTYPGENGDVLDGTRVVGSYPDLVAEAVDADTYYSLARCGFRSVELRRVLDLSYSGDEYSDSMLESLSGITVDELMMTQRPQFLEGIENADLITINIGSNDTLTYALTRVGVYMSKISDSSIIGPVSEQLNGLGALGQLAGNILTTAETLGVTPLVLAELAAALQDGQAMFKENWDAIITCIRELNPDATIVAVGMYNPFRDVKLTDESLVSIGKMADTAVIQMNRYIRYESECSAEYIVADVPDTEVYEFPPLTDDTFWDNFVKNVHPTVAGHEYMAQQILDALPEREPLPFTDVPEDAWYYEELYYVYAHGIMKGTTQTTFSPDATSTRAQVVTVLYRMAGSPDVSGLAEPFKDVPDDYWCRDAIIWGYNEGIIKGFTQTRFAPTEEVTRAQLVTMLYRYAGSPEASGNLSVFTDAADIAEPYRTAAVWAVENGVVQGYKDGSFRPDLPISRAQLAVILARYDRSI